MSAHHMTMRLLASAVALAIGARCEAGSTTVTNASPLSVPRVAGPGAIDSIAALPTAPVRWSDVSPGGRVLDTAGKPLASVKLTLLVPGATSGATTLSRSDGSYDFKPASPATYTLLATKPGYKEFSTTLQLARRRGHITLTDIRLAASPLVIEGSAKDRTGRAANGTVRVLRNGQQVASVSCANGLFQVSGLAPGEYTLTMALPPGDEARQRVTVTAGRVVRVALVPAIIEMSKPTR
jgi:hypothetical protein